MGFQARTSLTGRRGFLQIMREVPCFPTDLHTHSLSLPPASISVSLPSDCREVLEPLLTPTVSTLFLVIFTDTHVMSKLDYVPSHADNVKAL